MTNSTAKSDCQSSLVTTRKMVNHLFNNCIFMLYGRSIPVKTDETGSLLSEIVNAHSG